MYRKCSLTKTYYKIMGLLTCLVFLVGLIFYIILMVNLFSKGTDWLTTSFLILGLVAMVTILPTLANLFMSRGMIMEKFHFEDNDE